MKIVRISFASTIVLLIGACNLSPIQNEQRGPAQYTTAYDLDDSTDLSFDQLKEILQKNQFSKISDLLTSLSKSHPDYMSRYTLGYASKSLHESSREFPRAIVFGKSAGTIISFNGHPKQRAYEMLEVMKFDDTKKEYQFFEIEFNEGRKPGAPAYTVSGDGGPSQICLRCHINRQPLWHHYAVWPGFYGSEDDFPNYRGEGNNNGGNGFLTSLSTPRKQIIQEWLDMKDKYLKKGRYAALRPQAASDLSEDKRSPRPNTDLTIILYRRNLQRITKILENIKTSQEPSRSFLLYGQYCSDANALLKKDPQVGPFATALEADKVAFNKKAEEKTREAFLKDIKELVGHYKVKWKDLETHANRLPEEKRDPWEINTSSTQDEFYSKYLDAFSVGENTIKTFNSYPSTKMGGAASKDRFLFAILQKYFPAALVSTWPLNFNSFYIFEDGITAESDIKDTIDSALHINSSQTELKSLAQQINDPTKLKPEDQEKIKSCQRLLSRVQSTYAVQRSQ